MLVMFFYFFRQLFSAVPRPIAVKLGGLDKLSPKIRGALLPKNGMPKTCKISGDFLPLLTLIANIFGTDHHVESLKIPLSTESHSTLGQKNW